MTRELLESYTSKKAEIVELNKALHLLGNGKSMIDNDIILDYRSGYPMPQAVVGVDWSKVTKEEIKCRKKIRMLERECLEIEEFIDSIPDSLTRRIYRMYYLEGLPQQSIAKRVHLERSSVSKKISKFLQLSPNSHNSQL